MCDLFCGQVPDEEKWDDAQIGHYIGIGDFEIRSFVLACVGCI